MVVTVTVSAGHKVVIYVKYLASGEGFVSLH